MNTTAPWTSGPEAFTAAFICNECGAEHSTMAEAYRCECRDDNSPDMQCRKYVCRMCAVKSWEYSRGPHLEGGAIRCEEHRIMCGNCGVDFERESAVTVEGLPYCPVCAAEVEPQPIVAPMETRGDEDLWGAA